MNRKVTSATAAIHFAPTPLAKYELLAEAIAPDHITVTGNTVVDTLQRVLRWPFTFAGGSLDQFEQVDGRLMLVTSHRRESFGGELESICLAIRDLVRRVHDLQVVYPVHLNSLVRDR